MIIILILSTIKRNPNITGPVMTQKSFYIIDVIYFFILGYFFYSLLLEKGVKLRDHS